MKYVKFMCETPFCGTELEEYCAFEDEVMEVELDAVLGGI